MAARCSRRSLPLIESLESRQLLSATYSPWPTGTAAAAPDRAAIHRHQRGKDTSGDSLSDARNLGTIKGSKTVKETVGSDDSRDYYKFRVSGRGTLNLLVTGNSSNVVLKLLRSDGSPLSTDKSGGTTRSITRVVGSGTYYALVSQGNGTENYKLKVSFGRLSGGGGHDQAGNSLANARDVGNASAGQTFTDSVGPSDVLDVYRVTLSSAGDISVDMSPLQDDADVQLAQDSNGDGLIEDNEVLGQSQNSNTTPEHIAQSLDAGTYYVLVVPGGPGISTSYSLTITASGQGGAGGDLSSAQNVGDLSDIQTLGGAVSVGNSAAYYQFTIGSRSEVDLALAGLHDDADLWLVQDKNSDGQIDETSGEVLAKSESSGTTAEAISQTLDAGTYYAEVVWGGAGATVYSLSLSANPLDGGGPTGNVASTTQLGAIDGTNTVTGTVPAASQNVYLFSVASGGRVIVALTGLDDDANLFLYADPNQDGGLGQARPVGSSLRNGTQSELVEASVPAGTYAVHVVGGNQVNYTLTILVIPPMA